MAALEFVTLLAIGKQRIIVTWGWTATIVGWATGARTRAWVDALRQAGRVATITAAMTGPAAMIMTGVAAMAGVVER